MEAVPPNRLVIPYQKIETPRIGNLGSKIWSLRGQFFSYEVQKKLPADHIFRRDVALTRLDLIKNKADAGIEYFKKITNQGILKLEGLSLGAVGVGLFLVPSSGFLFVALKVCLIVPGVIVALVAGVGCLIKENVLKGYELLSAQAQIYLKELQHNEGFTKVQFEGPKAVAKA